MVRDFNNERDRFGSARKAEFRDFPSSCFKKSEHSLQIGFFENRPLYYSGMAGLLTVAGPRSGKLRDVIAYNCLNGLMNESFVGVDPKGQIAAISRNQTALSRPCYYVNARKQYGLPSHKLNPTGHIKWGSPDLIDNLRHFAMNTVTPSGAAQARYFEARGQDFVVGVGYAVTKRDGVLTLPAIADAMGSIVGGSDEWLDIAFEMHDSGFRTSERIEEEIAQWRGKNSSGGGGVEGVLGEITNAFTAMESPYLREALSPPFDFDYEEICASDKPFNLYLMVQPSYIPAWKGVLKNFFLTAKIIREQNPSCPRQTWLLEELPLLSGFPAAVDLFTAGAGMGIRPWAIAQSLDQLKQTGPNADNIILSSAGVHQFFGVRDDVTAARLSRMLGKQTLEFDDSLSQMKADQARKNALRAALLDGADPIQTGLQIRQLQEASTHRTKQVRDMMTLDEVMAMPGDTQLIWMDDVDYPVVASRKPYYEQRSMAGLYHPDPYHPPEDQVRVKALFGTKTRKVITEPVDPRFAHLPQYRAGTWSYIEGYRP